MPMICFASPKGGVGKTTLTANVAAALKDLGRRVLVLDFDIQNALRLHFGLGLSEHRGFAADFEAEAEAEADWRRIALPTASGVTVIPFGTVGNSALGLVADALAADPTWLERRLA